MFLEFQILILKDEHAYQDNRLLHKHNSKKFRLNSLYHQKIDIFQKTITIKFDNDEIEEFPLKEFDDNYKVLN